MSMRKPTIEHFNPKARALVTDNVRAALRWVNDFEWYRGKVWLPPIREPEQAQITRVQGRQVKDCREWPVEIEMLLSPPEFLQIAWMAICGGSETYHFGCPDIETAMQIIVGGHPHVNDGEPLTHVSRYRMTLLARVDDGVEIGDLKVGDKLHQRCAWPEEEGAS